MSKSKQKSVNTDLICVEITSKIANTNKNLNIKSLIDCGATCSIVTKKVIENLGLKQKLKYERKTAKGLSGKLTVFIGNIVIDFSLGDHTYQHRFLYLDGELPTGTDILMGNDILNKAKTNIQFGIKQKINKPSKAQ